MEASFIEPFHVGATVLDPFIEKKLDRLFEFYDFDGDGAIRVNDFQAINAKLCELSGLVQNSERAKLLLDRDIADFTRIAGAVGLTAEDAVSRPQFVGFYGEAVRGRVSRTVTDVPDWFVESVDVVFDSMDQNHDGKISLEEYCWFVQAHKVSLDDAISAFAAMDTDKDGFLSREDAQRLVAEYFFSTDPAAPGNHSYGYLPA